MNKIETVTSVGFSFLISISRASVLLTASTIAASTGRIFVKFNPEDLHENLFGKPNFGYSWKK